MIFYSYNDYSSTIEEMKSASAAIVLATVIKQEQYSHVSTKSTLAVSRTIKGKQHDQIYVFQAGTLNGARVAGQRLLSKGTQYMLFLGNQRPDKPEIEDQFFIKGGIQGIFIIDGNEIHAVDSQWIKICKVC